MGRLALAFAASVCLAAGVARAEEAQPPAGRPAPARLLDLASAALAEGRLVEARFLLDRIGDAAANPAVAPLEARYALASGDITKAIAIMNAAGGTASSRCDWRIVRGLAAGAQTRTDEAIAELGSAAPLCQIDATGWQTLATALATRGEVKASIYAFGRATALAPQSVRIHAGFGHALIDFGQAERASIELGIALQIDPTDRAARDDQDVVAGMLHIKIERDPTDTDERWAQRLGFAANGAWKAGDRDDARRLAARAVMVSPRFDADAYVKASAH